jgi:midasin (ATPase involved in ribosome maturation)
MAALLNEVECTIADAAVLLEKQTDKGKPVMMWGAPGLGKSAIVFQLGAKKGRKVIEYRANLREPVDVRGIPVPDLKTGTTGWCRKNCRTPSATARKVTCFSTRSTRRRRR